MGGKNIKCQDCMFITDPKGYERTKFSVCQKGCGERGIRKVTVTRNCDEYIGNNREDRKDEQTERGEQMSGGAFDYADSHAKMEIFGWSEKPRNVFEDKEISELIWDVFDLIHDYDWYASGDTCEETYLKAKAKFKTKWLKHDEKRIKMVIDNAIDEVREELYKTYGVIEEGLTDE